MKALGGLIGAVIGGAIGAAIWAAIAYYTDYEIGWIAWGVGVLTGVGTLVGTRLAGGVPNASVPFMAGGVALLAVLAGKYVVIEAYARQFESAMSAMGQFDPVNEPDALIAQLAEEIASAREDAGTPVDWPDVGEDEDLPAEAYYPKDIWAEAAKRWSSFAPSEQEDYARVQQEMMDLGAQQFMQSFRTEGFLASFGLFDVLWLVLAVGSAWKIAAEGDEA
ncbi:MAG: hypothetical protein KDA20_09665 [Phycisphaerales bacterium]|nr:hypothetical protein [Phycisphaerales bacterium]